MTTTQDTAYFSDLLQRAVTDPGVLSAAYTAFHDYSFGNQLLAMMQCLDRGLEPGPIATFKRWKEVGRHVKKGEKAIELCMPITVKTVDESDPDEERVFTRFVFRRNWFVLAQTDGKPYELPTVGEWRAEQALQALSITTAPFAMMDGNCQGYAQHRTIAISPVAALPFKTTIHEIAHIVLGHTAEGLSLVDDDRTPRDIRELEAEATAMLVCAALDQPGIEDARGYIQHWYTGHDVPEKSARRIMKATDEILKAGV